MKKILISNVVGGIGNQLFCYCCGYCAAKKTNSKFYIDISSFNHYFRKYEIDRLNIRYDGIVRSRFIHYIIEFIFFKHVIKEKHDRIFQKDIYNNDNIKILKGYFQSDKYIIYKNDILKQFKLSKIEDRLLVDSFVCSIPKNSVSIHVRRGDYVNGNMSLNISYYKKAIEKMNEKLNNASYIFFSDDIEYVKRNFDFDNNQNYHLVSDYIKLDDDLINLFLMSSCDNQIIANSTYSWWSAFLNTNNNKITIAPMIEYLYETDCYPTDWITIDAEVG